MFNQRELKQIKDTVSEFFREMGFEVEINVGRPDKNIYAVDIRSEEPQILIGQGGQTLFEIQHLLKAILRKKIQGELYIDVDVNNYKKKKIDYLKEMARSAADEASLLKTEKILPLMTSYERRIIHLELAGRSDVFTESIGEEPERKIIVKPKN